MRRAFAIPLLLLLLALPALQPLLSQDLTCGYDNVFHLWRAVEVGALLRQGVLFSRWAPHMAHGYGYPLFLFQAPLSALLAAGLNLVGLPWSLALNATYGLGLLLSGLTLWLLARDLWGESGGWAAAIAFLYAPFHAYVAFYRASLSETLAWSFPPLVLWGLRRWQRWRERRGLAAAVLGLVALMLTHDVSAYAFLPLFLGWMLAVALGESDRAPRPPRPAGTHSHGPLLGSLGRGGLALALGLGGSALFWLPALLERGTIQFQRAQSAWPFQYAYNFLPLDQMLALPRNADPTLINDWPPRGLGGLLLVLALGGGLVGLRRDRERRILTGLLLLALAGYLLLALPLSRPLWDALPPLAAFQFPWRFLAPATLIAALLTGAPVEGRSVPRTHRSDAAVGSRTALARWVPLLLPPVFLLLLGMGHWGWFYPRRCPPPADTTLQGMVAWERTTHTLGTTAKGELLPIWVRRMPQDEGDRPPWEARFPLADLPEGGRLLQADYGPLDLRVEVETPVAFQARLRAFYFPGWRAWLDGEPVPIVPTDPEGLIALDLPAGRHTVVLRFEETPLRLLADGLSLLSLILLLAALGTARPRSHPLDRETVALWPYVLLGLLLLALKLLLVDQGATPLRRSRLGPTGGLAGLDRPLPLTFGSPDPAQARLALLGHRRLPEALPADGPLEVVLYWRPLVVGRGDYRVGLTLVDEAGLRWSAAGLRDSRWYRNPPPTYEWPAEGYALTAFLVDPLPGTPPGDYTLRLSLFERETLTPLTIYDPSGRSLGPWVELGRVRVTPPRRPWDPTAVAMPYRLEACTPPPPDRPCFWGAAVDRAEAAPGDPALVTLFWSPPEGAQAGAQRAVPLRLVDDAGEVAASWPITLPVLPAGLWRAQRLLRLPAGLADGAYTWRLALPDGAALSWGKLTLHAPARVWEAPPPALPVGVTLGGRATLLGANLTPMEGPVVALEPGGVLTVTLVWRAEAEMERSYHVFLHLRGPGGEMVAQSDGVPAGWRRPTTGWLPGEVVVDERVLKLPGALPAGVYTLSAGLYDPESGQRLVAPDGADALPLPVRIEAQ